MLFIDTAQFNTGSTDTIDCLYKAIERVNSSIKKPRNILFATNNGSLEKIAGILSDSFPNANTMGIYTIMYQNGVINDDHVDLFIFEEDDDYYTVSGLIEDVSSCPVKSIASIESSIIKIAPGKEDTVCVDFTTGGEEMLITTLNAAFGNFHIPLIGGSCNQSHVGMITAVIYNGIIYEDACIYLLIKNRRGRIKVLTENIFSKYNDIPHFATKVDLGKKALIEVDGKPAATVLSEEINVPVSQLQDYAMKYPFARFIGDENFVIGYHHIDENGTMYNYKQVNLNDMIYVMHITDYKNKFEETIKQIKDSFDSIGFIFSIDCINRYNLYKKEDYFDKYAKKWHDNFKYHFGLVSSGEQYCKQQINQGMVCAIFENAEPTILRKEDYNGL